jgi:hypothetical protein
MITIFVTGNRLIQHAHFQGGQKYNKEHFINAILEGINEECNQGVGYRHTKHMKIHMDNCRVHNAQQTTEKGAAGSFKDLITQPIPLISVHATSGFLDKPRLPYRERVFRTQTNSSRH